MNVTLKHSLAGDRFAFRNGQTIKCSEKTGNSLIANDYAELADPAAKVHGELFDETAESKLPSDGELRYQEAQTKAGNHPKAQPERATTTKAETATTGPSPKVCTGETKQGNPCARTPLPGTDRCAAHPREE